jgi:hypothetical protein
VCSSLLFWKRKEDENEEEEEERQTDRQTERNPWRDSPPVRGFSDLSRNRDRFFFVSPSSGSHPFLPFLSFCNLLADAASFLVPTAPEVSPQVARVSCCIASGKKDGRTEGRKEGRKERTRFLGTDGRKQASGRPEGRKQASKPQSLL